MRGSAAMRVRPGWRGYGDARPVWTPLSLPSLYFWLRGDDVTLNGATVSSWNDKSGNARHWSQANAALQPTYTASAINGQPGLTFSAAATQYIGGAGAAPNMVALTAAETFVVLQLNADPPATSAKCGLWRVGNGASAAVVPFTDGKIYDDFGSSARKTTVDPASSLASPRIYSVVSVAGEWTNYLDGVQLFTTATNTTAFQTGPTFGAAVSSGNYLDGVACEWIVCSAKLSASGRANTIAYLKNRYGIA